LHEMSKAQKVAVGARVNGKSGKWAAFTGVVQSRGGVATSKSWVVQWNDGQNPVTLGSRGLRVLLDQERIISDYI
jgi:hypothetical protein